MTKLPLILALAAMLLPLGSSGAVAQSESEFVDAMAGDWAIYDDQFGSGGKPCQISLQKDKLENGYALGVTDCAFEFGQLTSWRIVNGQMALMVGEDQLAALGGNQIRMSGDTGIGAPVIMDRVGANELVAALVKAHKDSGCYYLGFTSTCVDDKQLQKPALPSDGTGARVGVQVNLNVRAEARDDAPVVGVVPANSCIVTDTCVMAADGVWCRAQFGDVRGWLKKLALRQSTWPVVTFVNQCATAAQN